MKRTRSSRWLVGALFLSGLGCGPSQPQQVTQLVVVIQVPAQIPRVVDALRVDMRTSLSGMTATRSVNLSPGDTLHTIGILNTGTSMENIEVTATGSRRDAPVITARASTQFVHGESRVLTLVLTESCASVPCSADTTCTAGMCTSSAVAGASLPVWTGTPASVMSLTTPGI